MAQKKPVKRLKKGGDSKGGGSKGGGSKGGSTQASGDGRNKPGGGGPSGGFSSAGKNLGGGGGGGNVAAPTGGGGGGGIPAPTKGGGGISTPAGGFGGEALPPGVSPQVAAGALAQLTGGKVDLRGIAGVPRGPGAPLARDVLTKQGPQELLPTAPVTTMGFSQPDLTAPIPPGMTMGAPLAVPEAGVGALLPEPMLDPFGPDPRLTREMQDVMRRPFEPDVAQYTPRPSMPLDLPEPGVPPAYDSARVPVADAGDLTPEQIAEIEAGALATRRGYALPNLAPDAVFTRPMMNPEGLPLQGPPMPPGMAPPDAVTYGPLPGETPESFADREATREIMERYGMETALDRPTPVSRPVTSAPVSAPPPMQRPEQRYTPAPDVMFTAPTTPVGATADVPITSTPSFESAPDVMPTAPAVPTMDSMYTPAPDVIPAPTPIPTPAMRPEMRPTPAAAPAPTAVPATPTPTAVPATPTPTPAPPATMTPDMIAADTAATAGGIPPGSRAPMGGGLLALGLNALNPLMRGSGQGLFGGGERMTADQIFAREAEMSRGGDGGMAMSGSPNPPLIPPLTPAPVAPATPTFTPPVYTPPPPPTPTRGYQSYSDLMRALGQRRLIPGMAGGGMVQPSMTNAFTPGSYYAAYDPRRRGLGGM